MSETPFTLPQMADCVIWYATFYQFTDQEQQTYETKYDKTSPTKELVELWCQRFITTGSVQDNLEQPDEREPHTSDAVDIREKVDDGDIPNEPDKFTGHEKACSVLWFQNTGSASLAGRLFKIFFQKEEPNELSIKQWNETFLKTGRVDNSPEHVQLTKHVKIEEIFQIGEILKDEEEYVLQGKTPAKTRRRKFGKRPWERERIMLRKTRGPDKYKRKPRKKLSKEYLKRVAPSTSETKDNTFLEWESFCPPV